MAIEERMLPASPPETSRGQSITLSSLARTGSLITSLDDAERVAKLAVQSKFFKNAEDVSKAVMVIMYGMEKGLTPIDALNSIYVINGKFSMYAEAIGDRLQRHPGVELKVTELTPERGEMVLEHNKKQIGLPVKFTIEMAKEGGYYNTNKNWRADPESMIYARLVTRIHKRYGKRFMNGLDVEAVEDMNDAIYAKEEEARALREQASDKPSLPKEPDVVTKEMMIDLYKAAEGCQGMTKKEVTHWVAEWYRINAGPDAPPLTPKNLKEVFTCGMYWKALEKLSGPPFFTRPKEETPAEEVDND